MTDLKKQELRRLAEKATPGEWWIDSHGHSMVSHGNGRTDTIFQAMPLVKPAVRHPETGNLSHWPNDWDASFIAAANPATILALLDEIERLTAKCSTTMGVGSGGGNLFVHGDYDSIKAAQKIILERDQLRAEVERQTELRRMEWNRAEALRAEVEGLRRIVRAGVMING